MLRISNKVQRQNPSVLQILGFGSNIPFNFISFNTVIGFSFYIKTMFRRLDCLFTLKQNRIQLIQWHGLALSVGLNSMYLYLRIETESGLPNIALTLKTE
jgi:hypothetical protein